MAISAASNIDSIRVQRQLNKTTEALSKTMERLASGLRINRASDDPAGIALATSLDSDARVATVAIRNANDGLSITSIADSALNEVGSILTRMAELATQSANGVYTNVQRSALSSEFLALGSEIERIAATTTFNGVNLLSSPRSVTLQVGFDASSVSQITIQGVSGSLQALGLARTGSSVLSYSVTFNSSNSLDAQSAAQFALTAVNAAITSLGNIRGMIGAAESRLSFAITNLTAARENFMAAASRIRDADIAAEAAELTRLQVLQQAGTAILAQANQSPARVLDLLQ